MGDSLDQTQYYVAAQAGEVYLDPMGEVSIDGFSYYRMYYKDAIDKLGVDFNVFRAGTFKSYTDQFSRSDMAPSEREETSVWLESLWNAYSQDVTRARSLPPGALKDFIGEQPASLQAVNGDMAKMALQRGLVTALKSRRQVADELKGLVGEDRDSHSFNGIGMNQYLAAVRAKQRLKSKSDAKIGIVVASGEIFDGHQLPGPIGGESTSDLLRQARYDNAVKAVVLRVDSPGGSEFASEKILREVQALRKAGKPVVVSMSTLRGVGRLLHRRGSKPDIRESRPPSPARSACFPSFPPFSAPWRKSASRSTASARRRLAGELRLDRALGPATKQILQASVDHAYAAILAARCGRQEKDCRGYGQDCAGPGLGRRRCAAHRFGGSPRRTEGRH